MMILQKWDNIYTVVTVNVITIRCHLQQQNEIISFLIMQYPQALGNWIKFGHYCSQKKSRDIFLGATYKNLKCFEFIKKNITFLRHPTKLWGISVLWYRYDPFLCGRVAISGGLPPTYTWRKECNFMNRYLWKTNKSRQTWCISSAKFNVWSKILVYLHSWPALSITPLETQAPKIPMHQSLNAPIPKLPNPPILRKYHP